MAACAGTAANTSPEARANHPAWLTGPWQATGWQVGADTTQARPSVVVTFAPDGTWKTTAGGSGTSWLALWGVIDARPGAEQVTLKQIR